MSGKRRKSQKKSGRKAGRNSRDSHPIMSQLELAQLGRGHVAYVRHMTAKEARKLFPSVQDLPRDVDLYRLCGADGSPIAITDTHRAAIEHAMSDELEIATVH